MNRRLVDAGFLFRNGHARCGGCRVLEDRTEGGRSTRKREGWTYHAALGWVCPSCSRWATRSTTSPVVLQQPDGSSSSDGRDGPLELAGPRGFGFQAPEHVLAGRITELLTTKRGRRRRRARARRREGNRDRQANTAGRRGVRANRRRASG